CLHFCSGNYHMAWIKLTSKALYLMAGGTNQYIDKVDLGAANNGEYQIDFPTYWFQGQDAPPRRMSVTLNATQEPKPLDEPIPLPPPRPDVNGDYYESRAWPWVVIAVGGLNCRSDAGLNFSVKTVLPQGTVIQSNGWKPDAQGRPWLYVSSAGGFVRATDRFVNPAY
ncbi:MAG: hypothetical protein WBD58_19890, partial [Geitlerinemataceae cyanobacterium]